MNDFELIDLSLAEAEALAHTAAPGEHTLIGGLICRNDGRLFSQRRSLTRKFCPGFWDNIGGHLEAGETLRTALSREVTEETGWQLNQVLRVIAVRYWHDPHGSSREYIVTCTVTGDLDHPVLETEKVDQTCWIGRDNLHLLNENRMGDTSQSQIYAHALKHVA